MQSQTHVLGSVYIDEVRLGEFKPWSFMQDVHHNLQHTQNQLVDTFYEAYRSYWRSYKPVQPTHQRDRMTLFMLWFKYLIGKNFILN